jgi:indole-3-glycerol phosphate synthase
MAEDKQNILEKIVARTRVTVALKKGLVPTAVLERYPFFNRQPFSVKEALGAGRGNGIIAEFKRQSPSKGVINAKADPVETAIAYAGYGASAMSVLTDEPFFGGSVEDLMHVREAVEIPLLRKDFIVDEYQLVESKAIGADFILLIAACLSPQEVKHLAGSARNLGLEVLLELHDAEELGHLDDSVDLVGINNRSLRSFDVNLQRSLDMAARVPDRFLKVAESGIHNIEQVNLFRAHGFSAFLMGEYFMKDENPGEAFRTFASQL